MGFAQTLKGYSIQPSSDRLSRVLKENKDKFTVSDDGFITIDLANTEVRQAIKDQLDKIESLEKEETRER